MPIKNKKGVSVLIGYILLIVFAVIISTIVFVWLKTYVPAKALDCPDGVSVFFSESLFNDETSELNLSLRNNGRFDLAGYFISASNVSGEELPTIDLSPYLNESLGGKKFGNSVIPGEGEVTFGEGGNLFKVGEQKRNIFNIPPEVGKIYEIRIIPTRFQEVDKRQRFVSCSDAKVQQLSGELCVPDCTGRVCGNDGCGGSCSPGCSGGEFCDVSGQCISSSCTPSSDPCGTKDCGTAINGTCGNVYCGLNEGECDPGFECEQTGQCTAIVCGNGDIEPGEQCDDGNPNDFDGCSSSCVIEIGWTCSSEPSSCTYAGGAPSCTNYCLSLGLGYTQSNCPANVGQCNSQEGDYQAGGDPECVATGATVDDKCCCRPEVP